MNRLEEHYKNVIRPDLLIKCNFKNIMEIPRIEKIIINIGVKEAAQDNKKIIPPALILELITGQKSFQTKAKKSIALFRLRKNSLIGCKVTLQNDRMYSFLDRLIAIILPRIKDFQGFSHNSFDSKGNFTLGINDCLIFPEIEEQYEKLDNIYGLNISIITTAKNKLDGKMLLSGLQIPM